MPEYLLDPCVEGELWEIWSFIANDNPKTATKVVEAAFATFSTLAANPHMGAKRKFSSPRLRDVRSFHITGYRSYVIFYRVASGGVQILHVYHGARDIDALFNTH